MKEQNVRQHATSTIRVGRDGRIFAHNLTPALASVLAELNPADEAMRMRAGGAMKSKSRSRIKITRGSRMPVGGAGDYERRATNE